MTKQEIVEKWKQGLSKSTLAKMYKKQYNLNIRIMRADIRNRRIGNYITEYEALHIVEKEIYEYLKKTN